MLYANFAVYIKEPSGEEFQGSVSENNFFGVLATSGGLTKEDGDELLRKLASDIAEQKIGQLADLDAYITDFFKSSNLPAHFSFACGYFLGEILLLKTVGEGEVYIHRQNALNKLIGNTMTASGYVEAGDSFIFTTTKEEEERNELLKKALNKKTAQEASKELALFDEKKEVPSSLFVYFEKKEPTLTSKEEHLVSDPTASSVASHIAHERKNPIGQFLENLRSQLQGQGKNKKITLIVLSVVLVVFVWSVVLGYQRRASAVNDKKTQETKELVAEKLRQAEDVAFLNLARATALIMEAKDDIRTLKKELDGKNNRAVEELEKLIAEKENKILKKEEKSFEEFFDLSVEDKKATGSKFALDGDTLVILDAQSGAAYLLSLSKKSLEKKAAQEIREGTTVAKTDTAILVFQKGRGIVALDDAGKASEAIDHDNDWGTIVDMVAYNNNLYLLDGQKGDIYKYVPAEKGFSEKSSYFKGQDKPDLTGANSIAIDLSVYVGFPDAIAKFTSGVKEGFNPTFPEEGTSAVKIITSKDVEKVYAWDKKKSVLYVINKDGVYERQVNSPIFKEGSDVTVFGNNAYILKGAKIYAVSVN